MNCINCSSSRTKRELSLKDTMEEEYFFDRCLECGVFFLNPQPTDTQLSNAYNEEYYGTGEDKFNPLVEKVLDWFRKRNARNIVTNLSTKSRILDIGCGNGKFLSYLGRSGNYELHGIEPKGKSAKRASERSEIRLHEGYLEEGLYQDQFFDLITLIHVFEHLPNALETLEIISKISKSGTMLILEIPNVESWQAQIFKGDWLHYDPPRHLNMFPPGALAELVESLGWKLQKRKYFSIQFSPFGAQQSILNKLLSKRDVLYEHLKGNKHYTAEYHSFNLLLQKLFHWVSFPLFILTDLIASTFQKGATVRLTFKKK